MKRIWKPGNHEESLQFRFRRRLKSFSWIPGLLLLFSSSAFADPVLIGSKKFTESYVLAEIAKRALQNNNIAAEHRPGMGGSIILWEALRTGQIDVYPEYTGTIAEEILKNPSVTGDEGIRNALKQFGVGLTNDLGFNNTYALVMRRSEAERLHLRTISDLRIHPELKFGLTHEFLDRRDGWRPLAVRYQLHPQQIIGIDHALGYAALENGSIDVKDAYSTDAKIAENDLLSLVDDLHFFPQVQGRLSLPPFAGPIDRRRPRENSGEARRKTHDSFERRSGTHQELRPRGCALFFA